MADLAGMVILVLIVAAVVGYLVWQIGADFSETLTPWSILWHGVAGVALLISVFGFTSGMIGWGVATVSGSDVLGVAVGIVSWPIVVFGLV